MREVIEPCEKAKEAFAPIKNEERIKTLRKEMIVAGICPDCGERLKRYGFKGWDYKAFEDTCPTHGGRMVWIMGLDAVYDDYDLDAVFERAYNRHRRCALLKD